MNITSLCVLSYERPAMLDDSMQSLITHTNEPYELIVHDDASTNVVTLEHLYKGFRSKHISKLVLQNGRNRGIARAVHTAFDMAEGEYIYKLDTDLIYEPDWLTTTNNILRNNKDVIMVGLFNYITYDPNDKRFQILEERRDCYVVNDFVSSGFGFHHDVYKQYGHFLGADGWHLQLRELGHKLAIPKKDVVKNVGFGIGKSTYVVERDGIPTAAEYHDTPHILGIDTQL